MDAIHHVPDEISMGALILGAAAVPRPLCAAADTVSLGRVGLGLTLLVAFSAAWRRC
jgi:hypothetical protein